MDYNYVTINRSCVQHLPLLPTPNDPEMEILDYNYVPISCSCVLHLPLLPAPTDPEMEIQWIIIMLQYTAVVSSTYHSNQLPLILKWKYWIIIMFQ